MGGGIFQRLAGLETEYVARFRADDASARPMTFQLLGRLASELLRRLPLVPADYPKKGYFLATGGAFWHERPGEGIDHPLIEGSTPECRGARQLLIYQRAQDRLLSTAARDVAGGDFTLCKSDCDALGNVYGSQENYSVELASGWRLKLWRAGVISVLLPLMIFGWLILIPMTIALLGYFAVAGLIYLFLLLPLTLFIPMSAQAHVKLRHALLGPWGGELFRFMPEWLGVLITWFEHVVLAPAAVAMTVLGWLTAFVPHRRAMLPFLITRTIFTGNGRIAPGGKFHLASKASGMRVATGTGVFRIRSIFSFGPQFKALTLLSIGPTRKFPSLLAQKQRLQISLADSNMCEEAEYLRIGTAMLVIDAIEAGFPMPALRLSRPIAALRKIIDDPTLSVRIRTTDGRMLRALEIQRMYLDACKAFISSRPDAPADARDVLARWEAVLDDLESAPQKLVGRVDWVTKQWLLEQVGDGAAADVRKKIDLRYHELSPDGYFEQLRSAGVIRAVLTDEEIDSAMVNPPPDSPATARGFHIRELGPREKLVKANWRSVVVGMPPKVVWVALDEV